MAAERARDAGVARDQTARHSCPGACGAPRRERERRGVTAARSRNRRAAGVATGTMPVAPPATVRRTAARSA